MVKSPSEIVKKSILHRATWSKFKIRGFQKNEWRQFRDFLKEITDNSLYEEIAACCDCSEEVAKGYVDSFVDNATQYIELKDIDSSVFEAIIETHPALMKRCEDIVAAQWEITHKEKIVAADNELQQIKDEKALEQNKYDQLIKDVNDAQKKLNSIIADISKYETLGKEVEHKIQIRIENARKDASDFISELAFMPQVVASNMTSRHTASPTETAFRNGLALSQDEQGISSSWENTIEVLEYELREAGVADRFIPCFASFMYSTYVNHVPLLLAGPCGRSIVNAFSAALFGKTAGQFDCSYDYSNEALQEMLKMEDQVIVIESPLHDVWIDHLPEILLPQGKHYILVCPFAEDLLIESRGLFNYVMPVLTEPIIDKAPTNDFTGSRMSDDFKFYEKQKARPAHDLLLRNLNMSKFAAGRLQQVLSDVHYMLKSNNYDVDFILGIFPYAYATDQTAKLSEKLREEKLVSNELRTYILNYLGEDE